MATHVKTHQSLPLAALVAAVDFEKKRAMRRPAKEANKSTASLAVEMAKDQHIRQLEEDLKELRREHEPLTHRYRQLSLQLQEGSKSRHRQGRRQPARRRKGDRHPPSVTARLLPRDDPDQVMSRDFFHRAVDEVGRLLVGVALVDSAGRNECRRAPAGDDGDRTRASPVRLCSSHPARPAKASRGRHSLAGRRRDSMPFPDSCAHRSNTGHPTPREPRCAAENDRERTGKDEGSLDLHAMDSLGSGLESAAMILTASGLHGQAQRLCGPGKFDPPLTLPATRGM